MDDSQHYLTATEKFDSERLYSALWVKAQALTEGDKERPKASTVAQCSD